MIKFTHTKDINYLDYDGQQTESLYFYSIDPNSETDKIVLRQLAKGDVKIFTDESKPDELSMNFLFPSLDDLYKSFDCGSWKEVTVVGGKALAVWTRD